MKKEENTRYKTRNSQLETLINTLYEDLHEQQDQIEKIFQNRAPAKAEFYQSSIVLGLKRQIREERTINKLLSEDLEHLKRNLKFTQTEEKDMEIKLLRKECARMRKVVQRELQRKEWNSTAAVSLFSRVPNEEDRR